MTLSWGARTVLHHIQLTVEPGEFLVVIGRSGCGKSTLLWLIERLWLAQRWTTILVTHDVEEAIALADRVVLIEHGHVAMNLPVSLPRPRKRSSAAFASLKDVVLQRVMGWQTS